MYVVESEGVLLLVLELGGMTAWLPTVPRASLHRFTVWYVDELTGEAVRVTRESA